MFEDTFFVTTRPNWCIRLRSSWLLKDRAMSFETGERFCDNFSFKNFFLKDSFTLNPFMSRFIYIKQFQETSWQPCPPRFNIFSGMNNFTKSVSTCLLFCWLCEILYQKMLFPGKAAFSIIENKELEWIIIRLFISLCDAII